MWFVKLIKKILLITVNIAEHNKQIFVSHFAQQKFDSFNSDSVLVCTVEIRVFVLQDQKTRFRLYLIINTAITRLRIRKVEFF